MALPTITDFPNPPDRAASGSDFGSALTDWIAQLNGTIASMNTYMDAVQAEGLILSSAMPGHFSRNGPLAAKTVATAADRYTLGLATSWQRLGCNINDSGFFATALSDMVLSDPTVWDSTTTDYTVAANRAGKDFFIYACNDGSAAPKLLLSANATAPTGYTTSTSRQLGGFHCLCVNAGTLDEWNPLANYLAGDILPASVWDQLHRPVCSPVGMVYCADINKWVDIYLSSVAASKLWSVYHGSIADGTSSPAFSWNTFADWLGRVGKRFPTHYEFINIAKGSNSCTCIAGASDPMVTGGHVDANSRRMVSSIGCEDCCGAMWQWGLDAGGPYETSGNPVNQVTSASGLYGSSISAPSKVLLGGAWSSGGSCGALCSNWQDPATTLVASIAARGVADPLK